MSTTNNSIHDEKAAAEATGDALVQIAYDTTPAKYHHHIVIMTQNKRIGPKGSNVWASVKSPYMTVAGRIAMLTDEHMAAGARVDIDNDLLAIGDRWVAKCTVVSSIHGKSTGHSDIRFGGSGVDATSPIENAETSAIGRALAGFGYGLFGAGLASADEVQAAIANTKTEPAVDPAIQYQADRQALCSKLNHIAKERGLTETLQRHRDLMKTQHAPVSDEQIASLIEKFSTMDVQHVESGSTPGTFHEVVILDNGKPSCSCTGFQFKLKCKHIDSIAVAA